MSCLPSKRHWFQSDKQTTHPRSCVERHHKVLPVSYVALFFRGYKAAWTSHGLEIPIPGLTCIKAYQIQMNRGLHMISSRRSSTPWGASLIECFRLSHCVSHVIWNSCKTASVAPSFLLFPTAAAVQRTDNSIYWRPKSVVYLKFQELSLTATVISLHAV